MKKMWIDGKWADLALGEAIEVTDPATEDVLDKVPAGTPEDVERAVAAAKGAYPGWRATTAVEKANMLHEAAAKMREVTFGPCIPIMPYDTFDEAIALANDTEYGLGACLYSHDARKVRRFYEEVQASTIWINDPLTDNYAGPFGGMKMSGLGRELGEEGLEEFWQTKHVHWDIEGGIRDFYYPY